VNRQVFSPKRTALDVVLRDRIIAARKRDLPRSRRKLPLVLVSSHLDAKKNIPGVVKAFMFSHKLRQKANLAIAVRSLDDPLHDYGTLSASEKSVMDEIVKVINKGDLWDFVTAFSINGQAELAAAYRVLAKRHSVFALTTLYEPFGLTPLEAMSCGLPAVVTKCGGPSESIVEGKKEFGVLVDPTKPDDIAAGILRILKSSRKWQKFSQAGIARVTSKYTWNKTADGYLRVIKGLDKQDLDKSELNIPTWFNDSSPKDKKPLKYLSDLYFG
jgi:sucrose-phosphate synthase